MEIKSVCNTILVGLMCVSSPTQAVGTGRSELASAMGIKGGGGPGAGGQGKFFGRSDLSFGLFGHHSVHVRVRSPPRFFIFSPNFFTNSSGSWVGS